MRHFIYQVRRYSQQQKITITWVDTQKKKQLLTKSIPLFWGFTVKKYRKWLNNNEKNYFISCPLAAFILGSLPAKLKFFQTSQWKTNPYGLGRGFGDVNHLIIQSRQFVIQDEVCEGLVRYGDNGKMRANLGWKLRYQLENGKTAFKLEKGKILDDSDFNAEDVKRNLYCIFRGKWKTTLVWLHQPAGKLPSCRWAYLWD